jgi:uncharacterized protein (TIGR03083 family)
MTSVVDALRSETARVGDLLDSLQPSDWSRETRCAPMRVHELAAHALRGVVRLREMLDAGPSTEEAEKDGATYFQYDPVREGPVIVERSFAAAREFPVEGFAKRWRDEWDTMLTEVGTVIRTDDAVYPGAFGRITLSEYLRTRAVEVTIHHMDLRDALGLEPDPDPAALDAVCKVLADLLGTDPRVLGMDGVRFALVGTGRAPLNDDDKAMLGPLADRIPVLA